MPSRDVDALRKPNCLAFQQVPVLRHKKRLRETHRCQMIFAGSS